ncbi:hypothetical protein WA538_005717, partial [Blastocystis sp. DL]
SLLECKLRFACKGAEAQSDIESLLRYVRQLLGDDDSSASGEFEELASNSILTECLLFCCHAFSEQGLSNESEKTLRLLDGCDNALSMRVRVWNEQTRLLLLQGKEEEAASLLQRCRLYLPQDVETKMLEAGMLLTQASRTVEEVARLREEEGTTLDVLLSREHACTKQLLAADEVLREVIQKDQRIATAWAMWGSVLELLGNSEKAAEAMLTSLEWDKANSFESVSLCNVVI